LGSIWAWRAAACAPLPGPSGVCPVLLSSSGPPACPGGGVPARVALASTWFAVVPAAAHLRPLLASVPLRVSPAGGFAGWLRPSLLFAARRPSCFSPRPAMAWLVVDAVRLAWRCSAFRWPPSASLALVRVVWPDALLRRVLSVWWTATRPLARLATRTARAFLGLTTAFTLQAKASHLWCRCWRCPWVPFPC
jgi:hypothetical protein